MRIVQLKRTEKTIYELTCTNILGIKKVNKIFPYLFGWRYCKTGKEIPYKISIAVRNIAENMKIGDLKRL